MFFTLLKIAADLEALANDYSAVQQKYDELSDMYRDKSSKHAQTQKLYDMLKNKVMMRQAETAASENVTQSLRELATDSRPATYIEHSAHGMGEYFQPNIDQHKKRSKNGPPEEAQIGQYHGGQSDVSGPRAAATNVAEPPGPQVVNRMCEFNCSVDYQPLTCEANDLICRTPLHRTALPSNTRQAANRSHIPMSMSRQEFMAPTFQKGGTHSSSLRHEVSADINRGRHVPTSPRNHGGILSGMKVGRARTSGDMSGGPRLGQLGGKSSQYRPVDARLTRVGHLGSSQHVGGPCWQGATSGFTRPRY